MSKTIDLGNGKRIDHSVQVVVSYLGIQQQTIKFQASESQFKANRFAYK